MRKIFLPLLLCCISLLSNSQDFSNKGKDFWLGYGYHVNMGAGVNAAQQNLQDMVLYFTSNQNANVTVEIPALGYSQNYTVVANQVTVSNALPKAGTQDCRILDTGYYNRGIHVFSNVPIVAYAHIYNASVSGASLLFPTNTLGQQYYSISFTQASNANFANNFFFVVATEDNTTVEITPSVANKNGKPAGVPFNVTLNKGQVYSVFGTTSGNTGTDLTGSKIRSVNVGTGGCKRIAVFSGAGKMSIGASSPGGSSVPNGSADNLFAQSFPSSAWGKRYLTSPTNSQPNNFYRVCVSDPTTVVKLNGTVIPSTSLINGFYYQFRNTSASVTTSASGPNLIEADKPVLVAQYCTTQGLEGNGSLGDPEMIYLSPVEQTINNITLYSTSNYQITANYINVIIKNGGIPSFKLDGVAKATSFIVHPRDPNYSYAFFPVAAGSHTVYSDTGFNAIAYGFGSAESYGYNAGTNVIDLYQYVSLQNQFATVNFPATCKGTPFRFSITLPYQPTKLKWDFNKNPNLTPNDSVVVYPPTGSTFVTADSSFVKDGKTLYVYKIAQDYVFSAAGTYTVNVIANNPSSDGCSGEQVISYEVTVYDKPIPNFTYTHSGCVTDSVKFFDATNGLGRTITKWKWEFGDADIDSVKNPVHKYATPGTGSYSVHLTSYTDIGCVSDTTKLIPLSALPAVKFGLTDTVCAGKAITITDSSTIAFGTIVKWIWDYGNGQTEVLTSSSPRTVTYYTPGTYSITLKVESNTGCSNFYSTTINVRGMPFVDFTLPIVCLPGGAAQFNNLSTTTGATGTLTYKWDFGDGGTSAVIPGTHNYSSVGPFTVKLTATSQYGCVKDTSKILSTIYPAPSSNFTVSAEACLRDSTTFTDASNPGTGRTITNWYWNRDATGSGTFVDTVQNFKYRYGAAGTYTVKMFYKNDIGCMSDTMTKTTVVNPLPTAAFINSSLLCETRDVTFTSQSVPNAGNIVRWNWNMGNSVTNDFTNGNTFNQAYAVYGPYTIKHMVETNKGCKSDTISKTININPLPQVGYILPEVCLADAAAVFMDTSKIADNSQSQFTYQWNFNVGTPAISPGPIPASSTIKNGTTKYNKADNYSVSLKVTSKDGCMSELIKSFTVNGSIPAADFNVLNPTGLCSNTNVQIQNASTVDFGWLTKVEIYWDFANSPTVKFTDDDPQPNEIYSNLYTNFQQPANKTFTIRFLAYSGGTCANIKTKTITVNASPKVQFLTIPGICLDASPRQITQATETGGVVAASPAFAYYGTGVNSTGLFSSATAGVGTFPIKYVYTSDKGCKDSATKNITVWPSPTANFGFSSPTCAKNDITFTDTSLANFSKIVTWQYDFGNSTNLTRNNANPFTKQYPVGGSYNVSLKVTTDSGCVSPVKVKPITINYLPVVNFSLPDICLPDGNGQFNDLSTIPDGSEALFTYRWDFADPNDPTPSTLKNPTHKYTAVAPSGGYQVKLKVTSKDGCIDSLTQPFNKVYPQPKANFSATPLEVCLGDTIHFKDMSNGMTSAVNQWFWDFGDGATSSLQNPYRAYPDSGTFTVKLHIKNAQNCISDTMPIPVTIHPYPIIDAGPDLFVLEGGTVQIKTMWYATDPHFLWSPSSYLENDTLAKPYASPTDDITYTVMLTGIGGCSDTSSVFIKVLRKPVIPNAFTPNGDGINDTWSIQYLESYPGATIEVFDRGGKVVFSSFNYTKQWDGKLNGTPLPVGTYYYIINPKNGRALMSGYVAIIR